MVRILNWKPSPFDDRDYESKRHLKMIGVTLPSHFALPQIPVYDQGNIGSCTANGGCACYRFEKYQLEGNFNFQPSRLFQYWTTRKIEGTECCDEGAYVRDVLKALNKYGVCEEALHPYITKNFAKTPTVEMFNNALQHKALEYARVPQQLETMKKTIADGGAIVFGFYVYSSFMSGNWDRTTSMMPIPVKNEKVIGGHCVIAVGWDDSKNAFLIQNSWGTGWGQKGMFWMPYSFILSDDADDFWVINGITQEEVPNLLKPLKRVFTSRADINSMKANVVIRLGLELGLQTTSKLSKSTNVDLVWEALK